MAQFSPAPPPAPFSYPLAVNRAHSNLSTVPAAHPSALGGADTSSDPPPPDSKKRSPSCPPAPSPRGVGRSGRLGGCSTEGGRETRRARELGRETAIPLSHAPSRPPHPSPALKDHTRPHPLLIRVERLIAQKVKMNFLIHSYGHHLPVQVYRRSARQPHATLHCLHWRPIPLNRARSPPPPLPLTTAPHT